MAEHEIRDFGRGLDWEDMTAAQQEAVTAEVGRMSNAMYLCCLSVMPLWVAAEAAGRLAAMVVMSAPDPVRMMALDDIIYEYAHKHLADLRQQAGLHP